jgi:hypothetical protein
MAWIQHLQDVGIGLGIALSFMRILKELGLPKPKFNQRLQQIIDEFKRSQAEIGNELQPGVVHELNAVILMMARMNAEQEKALEDQRQKTDALAMQVREIMRQQEPKKPPVKRS